MSRLTDQHRQLLREILALRCPGLEVFSESGTFIELSRQDRERIVDALSSELTGNELLASGEPTRRGAEVDGLVGYFVPYDLPMHPTRGAGGFN